MADQPPKRAGNRREFVRTQVSVTERLASAVILLLIVGISARVYYLGHHFNPDRYAVRLDSLQSTVQAVAGKSGTAPSAAPEAAATTAEPAATKATSGDAGTAESTGEAAPATAATTAAGAEAGGEGSGDPKPAPKGQPLEISLAGIKPMSDTEFYNSDTLYEKIDGRSPAYQSFNVVGLRCRTFAVQALAGSYVDVYEYSFDNPVDAFGMFALERDPKGHSLDFAADGYSGEMGYFFRQGIVYVQVIASDTKPETLALTLAIAQNRAKELPANDQGLAGRRKLPSEGMLPDSVTFVPDNAQGQSGLKDVFQAKYKFSGAELPFFVMVAPPADTAKAWQSFKDFCGQFGTVEDVPAVNGGKIFRAQVFGKWKVVYQREGELGGVVDATNGDLARSFVEKYLRGEIK